METYPSKIFFTWDIHYKCNYYCSYCFLHFESETFGIEAVYLKTQEWVRVWENIYNRYGPSHIHVTGGEPFTYPEFIDIVSVLSEVHTFEFSTNLSFDIENFVAKVKPEKVKITPSFHPEFINPEVFIEKYLQLKVLGYFLGAITIVGYPPFLEKMFGYNEIFKQADTDIIIYPYRGPYDNRDFPAGYNAEETAQLRKLRAEVAAKVSNDLMDSYNYSCGGNTSAPNDTKLCRMGQRYAKIIPNGEAFRCCPAVWAPTKTWGNWGGLGNVINGTFKLLTKPQPCGLGRATDCVCYKAMVVGEEERWLKHWISAEIIQKDTERLSIKS